MDTNTVIEGTVKFRDGKKWKSRWCVVRKLSPVADCIHLQLYRDSKERYKQGQTKASLSLESFLGVQSGFTLDKESNTLAIICQEVIVVLAFDTREHLMQWQVKISANLGEGDQFLVQISSAPTKAKLSPGPARLLIQEFQFCLTVGVPPRLISFWQIRQLRKFGVVEGKFCFEGGSRCGRGEGLYVLVSEKPEELTRAFNLAAEGRLFTRKRGVTRNLSVMDKARKHHTFRPESRLSNASSLDSAILESPQGSKNNCCSCSHSREDLLSWSQSPVTDLGESVSSSDCHRYDLKSLWNSDIVMGRCTSCMSKIGSMSRSSTLTAAPCSRFPAWTMDRPKSCGSQKMSPSATCSTASLSSQSSRGSSCGISEHHHRHSCIGNSNSMSSTSKSIFPSTPGDCGPTPPSRPPKPAHLSFIRVQSTPTSESPSSPSKFFSTSNSPCFCCHGVSPLPSPYGNYDIPKPLNIPQQKLKLDLKETTIQKLEQPPQTTPEEYYDTPRRLKDSLIWEYGNYDIPPPAQPVVPTSIQQDESATREAPDGAESSSNTDDKEIVYMNTSWSEETPNFHINKVKLTGEGRMPVMSPCGKIIQIPEPTYEEKLDHLLEYQNLNVSSENYVNIDVNENNNQDGVILPTENVTDNGCANTEQNYSNFEVVQSLQNYENFKHFFSDECKTSNCDIPQNNQIDNIVATNEVNKNCRDSDGNEIVCCSHCGHVCPKNDKGSNLLPQKIQENSSYRLESNTGSDHTVIQHCVLKTNNTHSTGDLLSNTFFDNKCNSTSCLHETKHDPLSACEKSSTNQSNLYTKNLISYSHSATNSPALKRLTRQCSIERTITSKLQRLRLRKRSNSVDSAKFDIGIESADSTASTDFPVRSSVTSDPSSVDSLCAVEKLEDRDNCVRLQDNIFNKHELKIAPLVISENSDLSETSFLNQNLSVKSPDMIGTRRSSSFPNKFFSNRDSSSSNDSGVSTGSLSLRRYGADFLEFEMPLTTSMSTKRHHLAMINNTHFSSNETKHRTLPKRSKSVDPLREITFTFESGDQQPTVKSTSAEAEVPVFLLDKTNKDYLSPNRTTILPDSRSTSSGTSDMSDYFETLSFSSFSSLDTPDNFRYGRTAPTMKPRSGKEYQKIDRSLLDPEHKE